MTACSSSATSSASPGASWCGAAVPALVAHHQIDLVIANVENAAAGFGITPRHRRRPPRVRRGRDDGRQSHLGQEGDPPVHRRAAAAAAAGQLSRRRAGPRRATSRGTRNGVPVGVINVMGRVFMTALDDPFRVVARRDRGACATRRASIFVDFHAEATSEKVAMGWHLDGRVTAVVGTHTHVQTADERVLPKGTAYITDVGMTGPHDSVIGVERSAIVQRFLTALPQRFETATENPRLNGVIVDADETHGPRDVHRAPEPVGAATSKTLVAQPAARALIDGPTRLRAAVRRRRRREPARAPLLGQRADRASCKRPDRRRASAVVAVEGEISNCRPWSSGPHLLHAEGRLRADSRA